MFSRPFRDLILNLTDSLGLLFLRRVKCNYSREVRIPRVVLTTCKFGRPIYSYFEKGCRKKCTGQSRKVLWVVLSSLFFKEFRKNGTKSHKRMLHMIKESNKRRFARDTGSLYVSGKLSTYPSPKPTLTLCSHLGQNVGLGKG